MTTTKLILLHGSNRDHTQVTSSADNTNAVIIVIIADKVRPMLSTTATTMTQS